MLQFIRTLVARQRGERGASAVEYALLVAGIAAVSVAVVAAMGLTLKASFRDSCTRINTDTTAPPASC